MAAPLSRLSPYNIVDDITRSDLYREVRAGGAGWTLYTIKPDEALFPELASFRVYGTDELKWVVLVVASLDDMRQPLPVGVTFAFPPTSWIRERIKFYAGAG